ncbi:MAG: hypothetical protein ABIO19_00605, partial [Burkholderiaceae bacterium]
MPGTTLLIRAISPLCTNFPMLHLTTSLRGRGLLLLLLLLCSLGGAAFAAPPAAAPAPANAPAAVTPIAVPNIAAAAENGDALLRDIVAGLAPAPRLAAIDGELSVFGRDFDAT